MCNVLLRSVQDVSIRARSRRSGRPADPAILQIAHAFQSAPAPVGAGDWTTTMGAHSATSFNPRPLP